MQPKSLLLLVFSILCTVKLFAQAPDQFSFQGVARNAAGKIVGDATIGVRLTIHKEAPNGSVVYQETHQSVSNAHGVFTLSIGKGNVLTGDFNQIVWQVFSHYLQIEIALDGGNAFTDLGTTQMQSVPYALHARDARRWNNSYPVIQDFVLEPGIDPSTTTPDDPRLDKYRLPLVGQGSKLIWYPVKAAFRAGTADNDKWEDQLLGISSFASGSDTEASGSSSTALGQSTKASADYSLATGFSSEASGSSSASFGFSSKAMGDISAAFGNFTIAKTRASFVTGLFNNASDNPDPENEKPTDRIFQIGNGISYNDRQNALTLLRSGNLGLGKNALNPKYTLEVDGRARIRHNGVTAGIHFDNAAGVESGFVGMKTDEQVGFFLNTWQFWVNKDGNGFLQGSVIQTSDARLKHKLSAITGSVNKISALNPYHYFWKDPLKDQTLQTGFIAQELEKLFPELVKEDEKGFKSVNYIGLIPHLVDSIKQLTKQNESLQALNSDIVSRLEALETKARLAENPAAK
ncbi:tail fiber domain-containing protein [Dyadobacter crusticola]|uniref:tail fiber domain-containing protein n=1 Tax=Dyadobacter crusticola TaxID=292407 RepID=UPI0004E1C64B|nr:tail fiber domain-containing protein [Dyadobacter crusticola]